MPIYNPGDPVNPGQFPAILAIGDSWFWYPKNNLLEALVRSNKLKDGYENMTRFGANGALLLDYVNLPGRPGKFANQLLNELRPNNLRSYSVFMVSGFGNDAVDYTLGLNANCGGATKPEDCVSAGGMQRLITDITAGMGLLMHEVFSAFHAIDRSPKVFLHGYDYALPDGRGFTLADLKLGGPWLKPAFDKCQVPDDWELRKAVMRMLIDRVNQAFAQYANPALDIYFIDSRGVLDNGPNYQNDWDNELHPTRTGFDQIVAKKWLPVLRRAGIAKK